MRLNKKNENLYSSSHRKITSNAQNSWTNVTVIRPSAQLIQKYCTVCTAKFNFGKIVITSSHYLSCLSQSANHTAQNDWPIVIAYKYYFPLLIFFSIQLQIYRRVSNSQRMCWFADLQTSSGQVILYCCSFFVFFCSIFVYQCSFGEIKIIIDFTAYLWHYDMGLDNRYGNWNVVLFYQDLKRRVQSDVT